MEAILITVGVLALAGLAAYTRVRQRAVARLEREFSGLAPFTGGVLDRWLPHWETLSALPALFRDSDYRWLRDERGRPGQARRLRRRRVRLAREYLRLLRASCDRLQAAVRVMERAGLVQPAEASRVGERLLGLRARLLVARAILPLNLVRLNLGALEGIAGRFGDSLRSVRQGLPSGAP